jgi:hypothetical protein
MSLINSTRDITRIGLVNGVRYRALVTENWDVDKSGAQQFLGRIKFKIPNFFEFTVKECPWAIPQSNGADGASSEAGTVNVPRVGSYVDIMFMGGSVYHPVYVPCTIFNTVIMEQSKVNYPNRKIHRLQNGFFIIIDEQSNFVEIYDPGDFSLQAKGVCNLVIEGNVHINSKVGNVDLVAEKGHVIVQAKSNVEVHAEGYAIVDAKGNVSVKSINGSITLEGQGSGRLGGIVTGNHNCAFTGSPHNACSLNVFST